MSMSDRERRYVARRYKCKYECSMARRALRRLRKAQRAAVTVSLVALTAVLEAVLPFVPFEPGTPARTVATVWSVGSGAVVVGFGSVVVAIALRHHVGHAAEKLEQANRAFARAWLRLYELRASTRRVA